MEYAMFTELLFTENNILDVVKCAKHQTPVHSPATHPESFLVNLIGNDEKQTLFFCLVHFFSPHT